MKITPLVGSRFRPDGGTMFGLVPKAIWSTLLPADEKNTILQTTNCLLLELDDGRCGLVETGYGDPAHFTKKQRDILQLSPEWDLLEGLARLGVSPDQLDFIILSHLHADHAGGTTSWNDSGESVLTFPRAQHFVHQLEWRAATSGDPLLGDAYPRRALDALLRTQSEQVLLVTDAAPDILPGVRMARTSGHTEGHCAVVLTSERLEIHHPDAHRLPALDTVVYAGDVCPTHAHLRPVFQTSFDVFPLTTRRWKQEFLPEIAEEGYLLMYCHDPDLYGSMLLPDGPKGPALGAALAQHAYGPTDDDQPTDGV